MEEPNNGIPPEDSGPSEEIAEIAEEPQAPTQDHPHPTKGKKFASDKPTISEIRRLKRPNQRKVSILLDSSLSHQINEKMTEIERLQRKVKSQTASLADTTQRDILRLEEELEILEQEAEELTVEFTFQDIGRKSYDALVQAHRPTPEEKQEYKDAGGEGVLAYSTSTFPPALVSACAIEPEITVEDATAIFEEWAEGDLEMIFTTALLVCKEPTSLPKSRAGTVKTRDSQPNLTTAPSEESPTPNS